MTLGDLINIYDHELNEAGISDARFEILEIIAHVLNKTPSSLRLYMDKKVDRSSIDPLIERLKNYEPWQYIVGKAYFFNEEYEVGKGVLIPRPDTELLVEKAFETVVSTGKTDPLIWDLCTGTGCVGISLGNYLKREGYDPKIVLVDKFDEALEYTRKNLNQALDRKAFTIVKTDVLEGFGDIPGTPDVIISNPPYINSDDMKTLDRFVKDNEPSTALFGISDDGLLFYRKFASCSGVLNDGGSIIVEHGYDQAESVREIFEKEGLKFPQSFKDYGGNFRVTMAYK